MYYADYCRCFVVVEWLLIRNKIANSDTHAPSFVVLIENTSYLLTKYSLKRLIYVLRFR